MDVMMTTCRCCGRDIAFPEEAALWNCAACGMMNARPQAEGPTLNVLRRATQQRLRCDFHNAETSYQHVLLDYPDEHEALWGLALCRYGVEYVDDPVTGKRMPTVHTVRKRPMQADSDFRQACELAPEEVRAQYEAEAEYIDDAMARICELAQSCPPYDVFICHKTTKPGSEEYTEDYNRAFKLYHMLDKQGYKAFFAPMEMEDVSAGSDYEAAIYHALDTSKVMLVVCSEAEYLQSPWVRSEYLRFLEMAEDSEGKCLLPLLYGSMGPAKLPRDFRRLQAIRMGEMGSAEKVAETVRRYAGKEQQEAVREVPAVPQTALVQPESVPAPPPAPQPKPEDDYEIASCEGGCMITKYTGAGGDVTIPSVLRGQKVVSIGKDAFSNSDVLTGIVIPEGVHTIGDFAFYGCFGMKSVAIPKSVREIGAVAFGSCWAITSFTVAAGNEHYRIENDMLINKDGILLHALRKPGQTVQRVPEGVIDIGPYTFFASVGLTRVILPESLLGVGLSAFGGSRDLEEVTLPRGIVRIDETAFMQCPKLTLRVHAGTNAHEFVKAKGLRHEVIQEAAPVSAGMPPVNSVPAYTPERDFTTKVVDGGVSIAKYTGPGGQVVIPDTLDGADVVSIEDEAFQNCTGLTDVRIEAGIWVIPDRAFYGCSNLRNVSIPGGVVQIGEDAFGNCPSLKRLDFLEGVEIIGHRAFAGCSSLQDVNIPKDTQFIGDNAFAGCSSLRSVLFSAKGATHPAEELRMGVNPFADCHALQKVAFTGSNVNYSVRDNVLMSSDRELVCYPAGLGISSYTIPDDVKRIGQEAFKGCTSLTNVTIPAKVKCIGDDAFANCTSLTLCVQAGSYACTWAQNHQIPFTQINAEMPEKTSLFSRLFGKK